MLIECRLKRQGGTLVTVPPKSNYHFKPVEGDENGPHVCEIENEEHIEQLLAIPEAYIVFGEEPEEEQDQDDEIDPDARPADANEWSNKQLNQWAKEQKLNHLNKTEIEKFGKDKGIELDKRKSPANMLRDLVLFMEGK